MSYQRYPDSAAIILVLGILGLISYAPLGTVAWVMGNDYTRQCQQMGLRPEGTAVAGRICGIIATALMGIGLLIGAAVLAMVVLSGSM